MRLELPALYQRDGEYWYKGGFNVSALVALIAGIAPCVPGFLGTIGMTSPSAVWIEMYHYAWFISFGVSFLVYLVLMQATYKRHAAARA